MYAVIATGGKQEKVEEGQILNIERLNEEAGAKVSFAPVLVVSGDSVFSTPEQLKSASVSGEVLGEIKGKKIRGFTYKNKSNIRRRWGHRQKYTSVKITGIATK